MRYPRLVIAGVQSGVGKTTLSLGLMKAFCNRGLIVQPFKVGPDYIDPGLHFQACGRKSHNLDNWMGTEEVVRSVFCKNAVNADISIIEGVMGLFDGVKNGRIKGSTADVAMLFKAPVVLVVDVQGMAQSCVALVKGFMDYEPQLNIAALVLNNAGDYHQTVLKKHLEEELGIQVLGCLSRRDEIKMPARHLGLLPAEENHELRNAIDHMAGLVEQHLNLDALINLAQQAEDLDIGKAVSAQSKPNRDGAIKIRIGVAQDAAFSFYYQDSLDYLEELGAQIVYFSPLNDRSLPAVDGIYLGGGFPEMFLPQLTANGSMLKSIREAHQLSLPFYAECGGLLYLSDTITDFEGRTWPGAGIVPVQASMSKSLKGLGYVEARAKSDSNLANKDDVLRGHEFHYSQVTGLAVDHAAYYLSGGKGKEGRLDGYVQNNLLASYVHLHLRSNPSAAANFMNACYRAKALTGEECPTFEQRSQT